MNRRLAVYILGAVCALTCRVAEAANSTTTSLTATPNPSNLGQTVALTATVNNGGHAGINGTVMFYSGAVPVGSAIPDGTNGVATLNTILLPASSKPTGTLQLKAVFVPSDAGNNASTSTAVSQTVNARPANGFSVPAGSAPTIAGPTSVAYGDFNGDGKMDLAVANSVSGQVTVLMGGGDGTFTVKSPSPFSFAAKAIAVADFNGDGKADLAGLTADGSVNVALGYGDGIFNTSTLAWNAPLDPVTGSTLTGSGLTVADFNGDGKADLAITGIASSILLPVFQRTLWVYLGAGDGTFNLAAGGPVAITSGALSFEPSEVAADFNNDGKVDLIVTGSDVLVMYWLKGAGDGTFDAPVPIAGQPGFVGRMIASDFDGDGKMDVLFVDFGGDVAVAKGVGDGTFTFLTPVSTSGATVGGLAAGDFNGDGKMDAAAALSNLNAVMVFTGKGDGTFNTPGTSINTDAGPEDLVVADFNGDNRSDFAVAANTGNIVSVRTGTGPSITSLTPSATVAGAQAFTMTIAGTGFASGDTVSWLPGGSVTATPLTPVTFTSSTSLTVQVPANLVSATGTATVTVNDPSVSGLVSNAATFTIGSGPTISTLSPTGAAAGGSGLTLTIHGANFVSGDKVIWQAGAGTPQELTPSAVTATSITVTVTAGLIASVGTVSVSVKDPTGVISPTATFTVATPPAVASMSATTAIAGGLAFTLTLNGTGFVNGDSIRWTPSAGSAVNLGSVSVTGGTQISGQVSAALLSAVDSNVQIAVVDPGGAVSNSMTLTVVGPVITAIDPTSIGAGSGGFTLTITGSNFLSSSTVQFTPVGGSPQSLTPSSVSSTSLAVTISAANVGTNSGQAQVAVLNGTVASQTISLTVGPPNITAISPASGTTGGSSDLTITVNGSGFASGAKVLWCNSCTTATALTTTFTSSTTLSAVVSPSLLATVGSASITVTNTPATPTDPHTLSNAVTFPISSLTVSSLSPTFALAGGPRFTLTLTGQNFASGANVLWGNQAPLQPLSLTQTQITVTVPANYIATASQVAVAVQNPNGSVSPPVTFQIGQLQVLSVAPSPIVAGTPGVNLTITGQFFDTDTQIRWTNGISTSLSTSLINGQTITASVPANLLVQAGTAQLTAYSSTANVSSPARDILISGPSISTMTPTTAAVGATTFALQVSGLNFLNGSTVQWTGGLGQAQSIPTTYVNPTSLLAIVPASLLTSPGTALVTVQNPGNGATGATSNGVVFTVGPAPTIKTDGTGLTPSTATAGGSGLSVAVSGNNFQTGAIVVWTAGGTATNLATAYTDSGHVSATVPNNLISAAGSALITVQNPGGIVSNAVQFTIGPATAPTLATLTPATAVAGSTTFQLDVSGSNFVNGAQVLWNTGSTPQALATIYVDPTRLSAVVPASLVTAIGTAFVSVTNPGSGPSTALAFQITATPPPSQPVITSLSQSTATAGGPAITMAVTGSNFTATSVVQWNAGAGAQALATTYQSPTQLVALVPASLLASGGVAFVNVLNGTGSFSNSVSFTITAQPTITANGLTPATASAGGPAFQLLVSGSNFVTGAEVQWNTGGGPVALPTSFLTANQLLAMVPASDIAVMGTAFVSVQNPGGATSGGPTSNAVPFTISAALPSAPTISSGGLNPPSAIAGGNAFMLIVTGTNYTSASVVQWNSGSGGQQQLSTTYVNSTQLTALVPANLIASSGTAFLSVQTPGGGTSNLVAFTINSQTGPVISVTGGLDPATKMAGSAGFQIAITGANFVTGSVVQWNAGTGAQALPTVYMSSNQLTALVPANLLTAPGTAFVSVKNPSGDTSNLVTFTVTSVAGPTISTTSGLSPTSVATGTNGVTLTVTGTNFVNGSVVRWNAGAGPQALQTGFSSSTQLTALVPAAMLAAPATALVSVQNPDQSESNAVLFAVTGSAVVTPTLTSISPNAAAAGSASFQLVLTGQNFLAGSGNSVGSVAQWNGAALPTTFSSSTQLSALVDSSLMQTTGSNFVNVVNPGGAISSGVKFQVVGPALATLSPATVTAGSPAFTLTLTGTNFVSGSVAVWNGTNLSTTVSSATLMTAQVPANLVSAAGSAFVLVTSPGGASTMPQLFSVAAPNAPSLSGLSPATAIAGGPAFQLTVIGSGFSTGSTVLWNGAALATGFLSSTQLTALVDSSQVATAGTANVAVQVQGAPISSPLKFAINGPAVTTLSPATASAGDPAFSLTVTGANFVPGSAVLWNANVLPTAYMGPTQLMASVPQDYVKSSASISITIQNPGGAVSAPQNFTVGPPSLRVTTGSLPDGVVGTFYSQTLAANGGELPYTWSISAGALPDGLNLDSASGVLSGTPTGAANIALGVTVTDAKGRAATRSLQLRITLALTITTASPLPAATAGETYSVVLAATGGTPPYLWSATGVLPNGLILNVATGEISGTPAAPGGYHFSISATDSRQQQTASKSFDMVVTVPTFTIGGLTATAAPAQQLPLSVTVASPFTVDLNGGLTLSFASAVGGDDPSIQFLTGGRTATFTIPAGTTQAVFGDKSQLSVSTGTLAGAITLKASLKSGGKDITPSPVPQVSANIPKAVPVITSVAFKKVTGGVSVAISGYSTTKEVTQATMQFNAAPGSVLNAPPATVSLASTISAWYQSAAAAAFGSQFTVTIPFPVQGDLRAVGSVTVTLTNTQGNSSPVTANLQ